VCFGITVFVTFIVGFGIDLIVIGGLCGFGFGAGEYFGAGDLFGVGLDVDGVDDLLDVDADDFGDAALAFPCDALFDTDDFFADVLVVPVDFFFARLTIFPTFLSCS
jgi:hypothetical protein